MCELSAYAQDCDARNNGGILNVYVARPEDVTFTYDADGNVTNTTFAPTTAWYKIDVREQNANYVEPRTGDRTARTALYTGTLTFDIIRRSTALRNYLVKMQSCLCGLVVGWEEATGELWVMGDKDGQRAFFADGTQGSTGATFADANVETIVFTAEMLEKAPSLLIPFDITP